MALRFYLGLKLWAAVQHADPVLERLDPQRRTAVIMALLVIALSGLALVVCTMLGAIWVRRVARQKPRPTRADFASRSPAESQRLRESLGAVLPPANPDETIHGGKAAGETKVDLR